MTESYEDCLNLAKAELHRAKQLLAREIQTYPTPISGCDAQFNEMLAERQRIDAALLKLGEKVFIPTPRSPDMAAGVESR